MDRDRAEAFFTVATRLAKTFVSGLDDILEDMTDEEIQDLTEIAAEHLSVNPNDPVRHLVAETINDEYSNRFNEKQAPETGTWIDF